MLKLCMASVIMAAVICGCSFEGQPKYQGTIHIQAKDKSNTRIAASLNEMVKKDSLKKSLAGENDVVTVTPAFAATYDGRDYYRIECRDKSETVLIDVQFDGKSKVPVRDTFEYTVYITPAGQK